MVKLLFIHHFNLWDYYQEVEKNNNIVMINKMDKSIKLFVPYFRMDSIQRSIVDFCDFYSFDQLDYLRREVVNPQDVILDVGANIGNHTVYFASLCGAAKVYSFEPIPEIYNVLCKNIEINKLEEVVEAHNVALGDQSGNAEIECFSENNLGGTKVAENSEGNLIMRKLDEYEFDQLDFIKIDIEEYEYKMLLGAKNTLQKHSPKIFIEIFKDNFDLVNKLLESYGYQRENVSFGDNYLYIKHI